MQLRTIVGCNSKSHAMPKRVKFSDKVETKAVSKTYKKSQFSKPNLANALPGRSERKKVRQAYLKKRVKELKKS